MIGLFPNKTYKRKDKSIAMIDAKNLFTLTITASFFVS